jgi:outer membrane lipoprotein SlyB
MAIEYDAEIIKTFATRLYIKAQQLVRTATVAGVFFGLIFGGGAGASVDLGLLGAFVLGAIGGVVGYLVGQAWAFNLRLQAQVALCQVQIEANTRAAAVFAQQPHAAPANRNAA